MNQLERRSEIMRLFVDMFIRKFIGWQIHHKEYSQLAVNIVMDISNFERYAKRQTHVYSDIGSSMKGYATLYIIRIIPHCNRPSASNDNPHSDSLFKTLKCIPCHLVQLFNALMESRQWMGNSTDWRKNHHHHSSIKYVTSSQPHAGSDVGVLAKNKPTYEQVKVLIRHAGAERLKVGKERMKFC